MREADCDFCGHLTEGRFLEETPEGKLICLDCDNKKVDKKIESSENENPLRGNQTLKPPTSQG